MFWAMYPPFICIIEGDSTIFAEDDEILIRQLALSAKDESMRGHTIIAHLEDFNLEISGHSCRAEVKLTQN